MQPTTEILERISKNSLAHKEEVFTRLYRYLLRPDIYYQAYQRLYKNKGAATKGVNQDTADGFSEVKIERIIQSLANETYQPTPVRRVYIAKKNNPKKKRPLGVPTFTDKLVQEALRMILEAIYEPLFLDCSHGFRPKRSCHTALKKLKYQFGGVRWFVEGDIKGCFDNINHDVLVGFISNKIKDARVVKQQQNQGCACGEIGLQVSEGRIFGGLGLPQNLQRYSTGRDSLAAAGKYLSARIGPIRHETEGRI